MRTFHSILLAALFTLTSAACLTEDAEPRLADLAIQETDWMDWQSAEPTFESVKQGLVVTKTPSTPPAVESGLDEPTTKFPEGPDRDLDPNLEPEDLDLDDDE
jgi:hypothetical protein